MIKHFFVITMLFFAFLLPVEGFAEIENISSAINKAGRQRMLSQRTTMLLFHLYDLPDSVHKHRKYK